MQVPTLDPFDARATKLGDQIQEYEDATDDGPLGIEEALACASSRKYVCATLGRTEGHSLKTIELLSQPPSLEAVADLAVKEAGVVITKPDQPVAQIWSGRP